MRSYEAIFILPPGIEAEELNTAKEEIRQALISESAQAIEEEEPAKRSLAYPIRKYNEGIYLVYRFKAPTQAVNRTKEALRHNSQILRSFFTVKG
jgi:small subunit ribosomal protein S6